MRRTGYVYEEIFMWHDPGSVSFDEFTEPGLHWENKDTKQRAHSLLAVGGLLDDLVRIKARKATKEEILKFHSEEYFEHIQKKSDAEGGLVGEVTRIGPKGAEIAKLACGGALAGVEAVLEGKVDNCYCLIRPPGHHAESKRAMGFCIFNNIAVAALHAKSKGVKKIAIVDFDVHHGNGTEDAFLNDQDVLFISIHQDKNYPCNTGDIIEGNETSINIPLPGGCGDGAYQYTFKTVVVPAIEKFQPELILVSAGFDAGYCDPLGQMMLSSDAYRFMTKSLMACADKLCGGKICFMHEGGYSAHHVPFCVVAVVEELVGKKSSIVDHSLPEVHARGYQSLQPHQMLLIQQVAAAANIEVPSEQQKFNAKQMQVFEVIQDAINSLPSNEEKMQVLSALSFNN